MQWTRTASLCSPLTPTVSCATEAGSVPHQTPSPSGSVPRASTLVTPPASIPPPHGRAIRGSRRVDARIPADAVAHGSDVFVPGSSTAPGSARSASHRPGHPRPRPPGSDSVMRLRSSLTLPGARPHRFRRRSRPSAGSVHPGSLNAQVHGSSPSGHRPVGNLSCERRRNFRGRAMPSPTLSRRSSVQAHS